MKTASILGVSPLGFHRIAYTEWGIANSCRYDGIPVICVHGLTRNGRDFDNLADAMQAERQIFCPDMAGRGRSDWLGDPALYGYPQYVSDMAALIARTGSSSIDWIGTSMGGIIGMLMAAMPNSPIRRLVLNDVGPFLPLASIQQIRSYVSLQQEFSDIHEAERYLREIYVSFGSISDDDWKKLAVQGVRCLPNGKLALNYDPSIAHNFSIISHDIDIWPMYDNITCPTLVLRGENSDILSAGTAEQMTQRGARAQLVTFKDCGHAPSLMNIEQIKTVMDFVNA